MRTFVTLGLLKLAITIALFLLFSGPARAAAPTADTGVQAFSTRLIEINRVAPLQNPQLFRADSFIGRRIVDKTNRVIGATSDLLVNAEGSVVTIVAVLDQVGIGSQTLYFDTQTLPVAAMADSYALPFHRREIRDNLPAFLSNIATAAGGEDAVFPVEKMRGAVLSGDDGARVGTVETALFNDTARQIVALAIRQVPSGRIIAVPYDRSFAIESDFGAVRIVAPASIAAAITAYVRTVK